MSTIEMTANGVTIVLSGLERAVALRGNIAIKRASIRSVSVVDDGITAARGIRSPGLGIPGVRKVGTWRRDGEKTFVSVRRNQPAILIELAPGNAWSNLLIGSHTAEQECLELEPVT